MNIMVYVRALAPESGTAPFRSGALDGAIQAAERIPGVRITAVAMDEPGGEEALRASLALAADEAFLLQGSRTSQHDITALGDLLADAVQSMERERGPLAAVFCGDIAPGQDGLGPALAGRLGWPQVTGASGIEPDEENLLVWRKWDEECALLRIRTPCVISFLPSQNPASYPKLPRLMAANREEIPTRIFRVDPYLRETMSFPLQPKHKRIFQQGSRNAVESLAEILRAEHLL